MPELPEVEFGRKLAEAVALNRQILKVRCARDPIVYDRVSTGRFRRALLDRRVLGVVRRGKHIWFELDARPWPLFHFGMTGHFRVPATSPLRLASSGRRDDDAWPPRFTKLHLVLDDGGELVMTNARRLGRIRLRSDPPSEPPISELGFDPLLDLPGRTRFAELVHARSLPIKALLLDQKFAAGVGNWIADEVLYQAGVDPRRRSDSLALEEVERIRSRLRSVVRTAVRVDAQKDCFPRKWLFHARWGKKTEARTARGERVEHLEVAGRTTAWVPAVQR